MSAWFVKSKNNAKPYDRNGGKTRSASRSPPNHVFTTDLRALAMPNFPLDSALAFTTLFSHWGQSSGTLVQRKKHLTRVWGITGKHKSSHLWVDAQEEEAEEEQDAHDWRVRHLTGGEGECDKRQAASCNKQANVLTFIIYDLAFSLLSFWYHSLIEINHK